MIRKRKIFWPILPLKNSGGLHWTLANNLTLTWYSKKLADLPITQVWIDCKWMGTTWLVRDASNLYIHFMDTKTRSVPGFLHMSLDSHMKDWPGPLIRVCQGPPGYRLVFGRTHKNQNKSKGPPRLILVSPPWPAQQTGGPVDLQDLVRIARPWHYVTYDQPQSCFHSSS